MIINAGAIGIRGEEFWGLSSYELQLQFKAARQRMDRLYELGLSVAWHVAAFSQAAQAGTLPAHQTVMERLRRETTPGRQTHQAQLTVMQQISAQTGISLQFRPRAAA